MVVALQYVLQYEFGQGNLIRRFQVSSTGFRSFPVLVSAFRCWAPVVSRARFLSPRAAAGTKEEQAAGVGAKGPKGLRGRVSCLSRFLAMVGAAAWYTRGGQDGKMRAGLVAGSVLDGRNCVEGPW